jgi:acyl-CoA oxidase
MTAASLIPDVLPDPQSGDRPTVTDPIAEDIAELLFDGMYGRVHADLSRLFSHEIFQRREGMTRDESLLRSYERLSFINESLEPAREIVTDFDRMLALHEWAVLADINLPPLISPHYNLCLGTLLDQPSADPGVQQLLAELEAMSSVGVFMMTELGYGSNAVALETEAVYDREERVFRLTTPSARATKLMPATGMPGIGKIAIVLARLKVEGEDHGVFPFLVRLRDSEGVCEGVTITRLPEKPALDQDNSLTSFTDVRVPYGQLLAGPAGSLSPDGTFTSETPDKGRRFLMAGDRLHPGRLLMPAAVVACCRSALRIVVRFGHQRMTFAAGPDEAEVTIMSYRSFRRPVFTALAYTYAMTFMIRYAGRAYATLSPDNQVGVEHLISLTKGATSSWAERILAECRERCGAQGMFSVNRIIDYIVFSHGIATAEGDNQVMLLKAAGEILSGMQYDAPEQQSEAPTDELLDEDFWLYVLREREIRLREQVYGDLQARMNRTDSFFDAWNGVTNDALDLARASAARIGLEQLVNAVGAMDDPRASQALRRLAALFALTEMSKDSGWLVSAGLLTADHVTQLSGAIDDICDGIEPSVLSLIDAFRIPAEVVPAPIAADDFMTDYIARISVSG